jgi:hypothetical protein
VIVEGQDDVAAALADGAAVDALRTAPWMAAAYGPLVLYEMMAKARAAQVPVVLDCADDADIAMAALRVGWKHIAFSGRDDVRQKLADIAGQCGAELSN